jgi:antirestriction protein ArdC
LAEAEKRLSLSSDKAKFGSEEYAKAEIRADMASLFLSAELGIPYDPIDQAGYINNWIQVLKNDKNEVFRAASDASKICDYILQREKAQDFTTQTHVERLSEQTEFERGAHH